MELTKKFSERQFSIALESWSWLDLEGKVPQFASLFGDVFLRDQAGVWWFLDTFEGQLIPAWPDSTALAAELETEQGQDRYLLGALGMAAFHRRGLELGDDDIYGYAPPPVVTGSFAVDEIQVFPFWVVVNAAGQMHRQLRNAD